MAFEDFDIVVLERDVPELSLKRGQLGIVIVPNPHAMSVLFAFGEDFCFLETTMAANILRHASSDELSAPENADTVKEAAELRDKPSDPDRWLLDDYVKGKLGAKRAAEVRRRLLEDDEFRDRFRGDIWLWTIRPNRDAIDEVFLYRPTDGDVRRHTTLRSLPEPVLAELETLESRPEAAGDADLQGLREWLENAVPSTADFVRIVRRWHDDPEFSRIAMPVMMAMLDAERARRLALRGGAPPN